MNDLSFQVTPMKNYKAPNIPKHGDNNSDLLKKMPKRWRKNAKVLASWGLVGMLALSGCSIRRNTDNGQNVEGSDVIYLSPGSIGNNTNNGQIISEPPIVEWQRDIEGRWSTAWQRDIERRWGNEWQRNAERRQNNIEYNLGNAQHYYHRYRELDINMYWIQAGGSGSGGYFIHLTEQEALGIVRTRLETAGLVFSFDSHVQDTVTLIDVDKGVVIAFDERLPRMDDVVLKMENSVVVGTFFSGRIPFGFDSPSDKEIEEESLSLANRLTNQADILVAHLQYKGMLEPFFDASINIDGTVFNAGTLPVIVNNHKMVPADKLFEALGMDVDVRNNSRDGWNRWDITASKSDIIINVRTVSWWWGGHMNINDNMATRDLPIFALGDKLMIPLRYTAEAIGANVEWDEDTRTFTITTNREPIQCN